MPDVNEKVKFWVKLGSQPGDEVTVTPQGDNITFEPAALTFTEEDWYSYKAVTATDVAAENEIQVRVASSDSNYAGLERHLTLADEYIKLKITEGNTPDVQERTVTLNVTSSVEIYTEGSLETPEFVLTLGQPLPKNIDVSYEIIMEGESPDDGDQVEDTVTLPKYEQSASIPYPVLDDDIVNGDRTVTITLKSVEPSEGISIVGDTAQFQVKDNDKAKVIITQHLPAEPTEGDIATFIPEIEVLGKANGSLVIQENDPLIKDIVLTPLEQGKGLKTASNSDQGLTVEIAPVEADPEIPQTYITFPDTALEAKLVPDFDIQSIPANSYMRAVGLLTPTEDGDYTFTLDSSSSAELWLNSFGSDAEGKRLIESDTPVSLKANQDYYIEALYKGGEDTGDLTVKWSDSGNSGSVITHENLTPFSIDNGFLVEEWDDVLGVSVDEFIQHELKTQPQSTKVLTRSLDLAAQESSQVGRRVSTLLTPSESSYYTFWVASNGDSQLRIQPEDEDISKVDPIAYVDGDEIYGVVTITPPNSSFQAKLELERERDRNDDSWELKFSSENSTPFGRPSDGSLTTWDENGNLICNTTGGIYEFAYSEPINQEGGNFTFTIDPPLTTPDEDAWYAEDAKCQDNTGGTPDDGVYPDYIGNSLTFYFQDNYPYGSEYNDIQLDGVDLSTAETNFPDYQEWDWDSQQQQSDPIYLAKGKTYNLEVLQVNSKGEDHLSVAWQPPGALGPQLLLVDETSLPSTIVPIRLLIPEHQFMKDGTHNVNLSLDDRPVTIFGEQYTVSSVTLQERASLSFTSGFQAAVEADKEITSVPAPVDVEVRDITDDQQTLNLTEEQQGRLSLELAAAPTVDVEVYLELIGEGASDKIELLDSEGNSLQQPLTFTPETWNEPQFLIVRALPDQEEVSVVTIIATDSPGGNSSRDTSYDESMVEVRVFPAILEDYSPITVKANQEVDSVDFGDPTNITVTYYPDSESDEDGSPLEWNWELKNGDLVASYGTEILRLNIPELEDAQFPIPSGSAPMVSVTTTVQGEALKTANWRKGKVTIEGITVEAVDSEGPAEAEVMVTLVNGQPTVEAHARILGDVDTDNPVRFSYIPQGENQQPIEAAIGETLITEFGELQVQETGNWFFEPNLRLEGDETIEFTVYPESGDEETVTVPLDDYARRAQIATSQVALPNAEANRAELTVLDANQNCAGDDKINTVCESDGSVTVKITLEQNVDRDIEVYYDVDEGNITDPGNIALNLSPVDIPELEQSRALELENGLSLEDPNLTAEMWVRPAALSETQGLLVGGNAKDSSESALLGLNENTLTTISGFSATLPEGIEADTWFHIAYKVSEAGQVLYVNGQKLASDTKTAEIPEVLKAIGRDENNYFHGVIDEVRIWNVARTDGEIQASHTTSLDINDASVEAHLIGYWTFNNLDLENDVNDTTKADLKDESGELVNVQDPTVGQVIWQIRQSATEGEDYGPLNGFASQQLNLFNLDGDKLGGRTTFTIADFNGDTQPDAAIVDGLGELWMYTNKGLKRDGKALFKAQRLGINLDVATPITAGDVDGDRDIDLVIGTADGEVHLIENRGNQRSSARFQGPKQLMVAGKALKMGSAVSPTLADLNGDGVPELVTISQEGQIAHFEMGKAGVKRSNAVLLPQMPPTQQGYLLQFIDLDKDGDLDALVDYARNQPGQRPGGYRYFKNYGTAEQPYFVEAPHDLIAYYLRGLDNEVTYGGITLRHPYDQVEFYNFADWDGDGDLDLFQSDNKGLIHLRSNNLNSVTIEAGSNTGTITIPIIDDDEAEPTEFIKLRLVDGQAGSPDYYADANSGQVVIEIDDNDEVGIAVFDENGTNEVTEPIYLEEETESEETYTVKLASQPTSDVYLTITTNSLHNGLVAKEGGEFTDSILLYFPPDAWDTFQTFHVKGVNDDFDDEDAPFSYRMVGKSADSMYDNLVKNLEAISVNNDTAGLSMTFDSLPEAALAEGAIHTTEGEINTVKVALTSQPFVPVTLTLAPEDTQLSFYPQRRIAEMVMKDEVTKKYQKTLALRGTSTTTEGRYGTLEWEENGAFTYNQTTPADAANLTENFSYGIDNGYGSLSHDVLTIPLPFIDPDELEEGEDPPLLEDYTGNLFFNPNQLAGEPMRLTFTPQDWNLERTVAVAAVDDDLVEYNHDSHIQLLLTDPNLPVSGAYGTLRWNPDGTLSYTPQPDLVLAEGQTSFTDRFLFTQSDDPANQHYLNHTLDLTITPEELAEEEEETYKVVGVVDQNPDSSFELSEVLDDNDVGTGTFSEKLPGIDEEKGPQLTGVSLTQQDPVYAAYSANVLTVNIEDNDKPILRAGVDLNATENTHPGYFTLSVLEAVGYPGGLPVHYTLYGTEDEKGATAERREENNGDPGPDFQGFEGEEIQSGTLYIPEGKTRVNFPIFPIDDFTPEESLGARYEKVIVEITPPTEEDYYVLDRRYPETQKAAVRILDNEEVGLKFVLPESGLAIDEGELNGFRVGLKSQPQQEVELKFYYDSILANNQPDRTFLEVPSVTFSKNNWNQWRTVDVGLFNNLIANDGDLAPRYTDIYYTLGEDSQDPFYNSFKGALNLRVDDDNGEVDAVDGIVDISDTTGEYGTITLTDVAGDYLGDFDYDLTVDIDTLTEDETFQDIGKVLDVFDYTFHSENGDDFEQQLAVEIRALNQTNLDEDKVGKLLEGDFGGLTLNQDGTYIYDLDRDKIADRVGEAKNWTVHDSFVYLLHSPGDDDEPAIDTRYALNIAISHDGETGEDSAVVNGELPVCNTDPVIETVCDDQVSGSVVVQEEQSVRAAEEKPPEVTKVGRTTPVPVVTNMYLRDREGNDIRDKDDEPVLANPIFDTNHIGSVEDSLPIPDGGNTEITGTYGTLNISSTGEYTYTVDMDVLTAGLEDYDDRTVHDRFRYHLSDNADGYLELVSVYQSATPEEPERVSVLASGSSLDSDEDDNTVFKGSLISLEDETIKADRIAPAHSTVYLQEQTLDPVVMAEGLTNALSLLQDALYDTDIPLMGRLGGGNGGENAGTNNSSQSRIPGFWDRMLAIVESSILQEPHFTTKELETTMKKALNEAFGSGGVPVRVLKLDTEKILLKMSFGGGYGWTSKEFGDKEPPLSEELDTDAGVPDLFTVQGQFGVGFRAGLDLVLGLKFRFYEPELDDDGEPIEGQRKYSPSIFVVVDKTALNNLMGTPDSQGTELYPIQTEKGPVLPSAVEFVPVQFNDGGLINRKAPPQGTLNANLPNNVRFRWHWGEAQADLPFKSVNFGGSTSFCQVPSEWKPYECPAKPAASKIVGYYVDKDKQQSVKAIEISLEQPQAIEANAHTELQMTAIADPDHLLESTTARLSGKRALVIKALDYLKQGVKFDDAEILVTDIYRETSQPLKTSFTAQVKLKTDSTVGSVSPQRYEASLSVDSTKPTPEIPQDTNLLLASATSADETLRFEADRLTLSGDELNKTENIYARGKPWEIETKNGKIKLASKLRANKWQWVVTYTAAGRDTIDWGDERGYPEFFKDVSFTVKDADGSQSQELKYTLSGLTGPKFTETPSKKDETKLDPVTKISVELGANLDFGTSAKFLFMTASLDQAVEAPANPAEGKETPKVFEELVAQRSDRDQLVDIPATTELIPIPTTEIYGDHGTLLMDQEGHFGYRLAKSLTMDDNYDLNCVKDALPPEDQILCTHILATTDGNTPANWSDPDDGTEGILPFMGRKASCPGTFESVVAGTTDCTISSEKIVISGKNKDDLKLYGVPSLESAATVGGAEWGDNSPDESTDWTDITDLDNSMTRHQLYQHVQSKNAYSAYGVETLEDEFYIQTNQDYGSNFRKLVLTIKSEHNLGFEFDGDLDPDYPFIGHDFNGDDTDDGWINGCLFDLSFGGCDLHNPTVPTVERVGPGQVQPVAKATVYIELALKDISPDDPYTSVGYPYKNDGLLTWSEIRDAKKKNFVQFGTNGGAAFLFKVNAGFTCLDNDNSCGNATSISEGGLPLPNAQFKLGMDLNYKLLLDKGDGMRRGGQFAIGIYDLGVDLGETISEKMAPIIVNIDETLEPIKPIVNALNEDTKFLSKIGLQGLFDQDGDGKVTILEIPVTLATLFSNSQQGQKYANKLKTFNRFADFIAGIGYYYSVFTDLAAALSGEDLFETDIVSSDGYIVSPNEVHVVPESLGTGSGWALTSPKFVPYADELGHIILGSSKSFAYEKSFGTKVSTSTITEVTAKANPEPITNSANHGKLGTVKNALQAMQNWQYLTFPILSNPLDMLRLIFGESATLVQFDVPDFELNFDISKSFNIPFPFASGIVKFDLDLGTDTDFALDTYGFQQFMCNDKNPTGLCWDKRERNHPEYIVNSIFIPDWTKQSYDGGDPGYDDRDFWRGSSKEVNGTTIADKNELYGNIKGGVGGGIDLGVASGHVLGGPGIGGGFDLLDVGELALEPIYDGKFRALDFYDRISDPLSLFDLQFKFYIFLDIIIKSFGAVVWEKTLGTFPLFEFSFGGADGSRSSFNLNGNPVVGSTIFFDTNGNLQPDAGEPLTFSDSQGRSALHIPYVLFDKNDDGVIDEQDGRIVMLDGVDAVTGVPLNKPLVSVPQAKVISPLTTLTNQLINEGLSPEAAEAQLKTILRFSEVR